MKLYLLELGTIRALEIGDRRVPKAHPIQGYLIRLDDGTDVLVDTGFPADAPGSVPVDHPAQGLLAQLAGLGVVPADVRYVVCSHLDPDHAGHHDAFPDAEFVVQRSHYELARAGRVPRLEMARRHWDLPQLRYRLVDGDTELLPGIELVESGGHVAGHQSVLVRLPRTGPVLLAVDAITRPEAMDPADGRTTLWDLEPETARRSVRKLVALAARERALIVRGHDAAQWPTLRHAPQYYD